VCFFWGIWKTHIKQRKKQEMNWKFYEWSFSLVINNRASCVCGLKIEMMKNESFGKANKNGFMRRNRKLNRFFAGALSGTSTKRFGCERKNCWERFTDTLKLDSSQKCFEIFWRRGRNKIGFGSLRVLELFLWGREKFGEI
jgi:hypothetical protein